jgi:hypothetical protein
MKILDALKRVIGGFFSLLAMVFLTNEGFALLLIAASLFGCVGLVLGFVLKRFWWAYGLVWFIVLCRWS